MKTTPKTNITTPKSIWTAMYLDSERHSGVTKEQLTPVICYSYSEAVDAIWMHVKERITESCNLPFIEQFLTDNDEHQISPLNLSEHLNGLDVDTKRQYIDWYFMFSADSYNNCLYKIEEHSISLQGDTCESTESTKDRSSILINIDTDGKVASVVTDSEVKLEVFVLDRNCEAMQDNIVVDWQGVNAFGYSLDSYTDPEKVKWAYYLCEEDLEQYKNQEDEDYQAVYGSGILTVSGIETEQEGLTIRFNEGDEDLGVKMEVAINKFLES